MCLLHKVFPPQKSIQQRFLWLYDMHNAWQCIIYTIRTIHTEYPNVWCFSICSQCRGAPCPAILCWSGVAHGRGGAKSTCWTMAWDFTQPRSLRLWAARLRSGSGAGSGVFFFFFRQLEGGWMRIQGLSNCAIWRDQKMQLYGHFEWFDLGNALFGLVIQYDPWNLSGEFWVKTFPWWTCYKSWWLYVIKADLMPQQEDRTRSESDHIFQKITNRTHWRDP